MINRRDADSLSALSERLGWDFGDTALLAQAMAHRSWCAENPGSQSNERLEFLGDAVLGLVVTDHMYSAYPEMPEGHLAKLRASVVNAVTLAELAMSVDIGAALLLGKGEDQSGGRAKQSILADAMEAVIGAVYLDGGWEPAAILVMALLRDRIEAAAEGPGGQDYKTRLQEHVARHFEELPRYEVTEVGPDHAKAFTAQVLIGSRVYGVGNGSSKKQAEQQAASAALREIHETASSAADDAAHTDVGDTHARTS